MLFVACRKAKLQKYLTVYIDMAGKKQNKKKTNTKQKRNAKQKKADSKLATNGPPVKMLKYNGLILPQLFRTKLKYCEDLQIFGTIVSSEMVQANSLYDPRGGIGGHQPRGFDQFSTLYNRYLVLGCTVSATVSVVPGGSGSNHGWVAITGLPAGASAILTHNGIRENVRTLYKSVSAHDKAVTISKYFSCADLQGQPYTKYYTDDVYDAAVSGNPQRVVQVQVSYGSRDPSINADLSVEWSVIYHVEFRQLREVLQS